MTGIIMPFCFAVSALKRLTNSPMLTPCCESAGPPAGHCNFTFALISFFAIGQLSIVHGPLSVAHVRNNGRGTRDNGELLNLLYLRVFHFDRSIPSKNGNFHLQ